MENSTKLNGLIELSFLRPNILKCTVKQNWVIELAELKILFSSMEEMVKEGRKIHLIWIMHTKIEPGKGVMDCFSDVRRTHFFETESFCIQSTFVKHLGNLYLKLKNPSIPSKIFSLEEEALAWIDAVEG